MKLRDLKRARALALSFGPHTLVFDMNMDQDYAARVPCMLQGVEHRLYTTFHYRLSVKQSNS